jgi:drug/metabolite transporter (DMT)-like permease
MDWFVFAFFASFLWAIGVIIDKYILTEHMQDPFSYQILYTITEAPILILPLFTPISFVFPWFVLGILGGFGMYFGLVLYFRAIALEEASRVISVLYVSPIFVLPLAYIFLGEKLTLPAYLGVGFLALGAILISHKKAKGKRVLISSTLGLILASDVVWAGYEVLTKYVLDTIEFTSYLFWNFIGTAILAFSLLSFSRIRRNFLGDIQRVSKNVHFWRIINTSLNFCALVFYYIAISAGLVSLVSTSLALEPFFVFLLAVPLSLYVPSILKEETRRNVMILKAVAIVIIIIGTWLITN